MVRALARWSSSVARAGDSEGSAAEEDEPGEWARQVSEKRESGSASWLGQTRV